MPTTKLMGLFLLVGGAIVLAVAYQQSGSFGDQTKHFFTGDYRDKTNSRQEDNEKSQKRRQRRFRAVF